MERTVVTSENAPRSTSPLSPAIRAGDDLFVSGQVGVNPTNPPARSCVEV
jgi:enamine deaminase RidA (YjgF/YER057c/UK114 family)